jgi:hypothetical protein
VFLVQPNKSASQTIRIFVTGFLPYKLGVTSEMSTRRHNQLVAQVNLPLISCSSILTHMTKIVSAVEQKTVWIYIPRQRLITQHRQLLLEDYPSPASVVFSNWIASHRNMFVTSNTHQSINKSTSSSIYLLIWNPTPCAVNHQRLRPPE